MNKNNLTGLSPLWLISLALVLGTAIVSLIPVSIATDIKSSDWIGFAGSIAAGVMTLIAAAFAWSAVQSQIEAQNQIASRQLAIQSFDVLIRQTELLEEEMRFVNAALLKNGRFHAVFGSFGVNDGRMARGTAQKAIVMIEPYLADVKAERARLLETRTRRWIAPDIFTQRAQLHEALDHLEVVLPSVEYVLRGLLMASTESGFVTDGDLARIRAANPFEALNAERKAFSGYGEAIDKLRLRVHAQTAKARIEIGI
jgi:hypothetical protein